jgi:hypothetical protein
VLTAREHGRRRLADAKCRGLLGDLGRRDGVESLMLGS